MDSEKLRIIKTAESIYLSKGFYKTTVDELAHALKMSKKTIYKHFPTKKDLLIGVVENIKSGIKKEIQKIINSDFNPVEKMYYIFEFIAQRAQKLSGNWMEDLQTYSTDVWKGVEEFRKEMITNNLIKAVTEGKAQKLVINQPPILMINILLSAANGVVNPDFLINTNISAKQAIETTLNVILTGILTPKGRRILKQIKEKENEDN